jgi:hypothetical protein
VASTWLVILALWFAPFLALAILGVMDPLLGQLGLPLPGLRVFLFFTSLLAGIYVIGPRVWPTREE